VVKDYARGRWHCYGRSYLTAGLGLKVFAPDALLALLAEHVRTHAAGDDTDRWLFSGQGGLPIHENSVGHLRRKVRAAVGVGYRLHDLRHFYASGLISAGCDVVTVQRALGHHSGSVTLKTYAHLRPDASDRTRQAAGELFAACVDTPADALRTDSP
jgi:integrase